MARQVSDPVPPTPVAVETSNQSPPPDVTRPWISALILIALLPLAYFSVQIMRWWGGLMALSQRPAFKRVET